MGRSHLVTIVGVGLVILAIAESARAQSESRATSSFAELQRRLHQGDTVSVETATERTIVGQVLRLSDVSLEIMSRGTPIRLDEPEIRRIRLRDPIDSDRLKSAAGIGLLAALACASSSKCRPWETGHFSLGGMLGFVGFCGAGAAAGAITAATVDALHTPTLFVSPARKMLSVQLASAASRRGLAVNLMLRF